MSMVKDIRTALSRMGLNYLPSGRTLVEEGRELSKSVKLGTTLFMEKYGVSSEREYKERMKKERKPMFHFHYGLSNFEMSARGLELIYNETTSRGHRVDRFGACLDRVMGLPEEMRDKMPRETGLKLDTPSDWAELGRIVPIQPHMGDHMVGSPASLENLLKALSAGVTTIGTSRSILPSSIRAGPMKSAAPKVLSKRWALWRGFGIRALCSILI